MAEHYQHPLNLAVCNLWDYNPPEVAVARVITTNGYVNSQGRCVMGKGVADQCRDKYPGIDFILGQGIKEYGNHVQMLPDRIISFPVKQVWWEIARQGLIEESAKELIDVCTWAPEYTYVMPFPGIGNGGLRPEDIMSSIELLIPHVTFCTVEPLRMMNFLHRDKHPYQLVALQQGDLNLGGGYVYYV